MPQIASSKVMPMVMANETTYTPVRRIEDLIILVRGQRVMLLAELEGRIVGHDEAIQNLFEAIRQLVEPPLPETRRQIGFLRETAPPYRVKKLSRN
jgi:hypothetical protein